tara:strand:+ start:209 stop:763 length:555 start_codon:yes stop_codon:yes gene_type:complete
MKLGWSVKSSRVAYRGRFPVIEDELIADLDGREHLYTYLGFKGSAVSVIAIEDDRILLVREYRHPVDRIVTDLPTGSVSAGENPFDAAHRELREETGYEADGLFHLGGLIPVPALANLRVDYYVASALNYVGHERDDSEIMEVEWIESSLVLSRFETGDYIYGTLPHGLLLAERSGVLRKTQVE